MFTYIFNLFIKIFKSEDIISITTIKEPMELFLKRMFDDHQSTTGLLYTDKGLFCATLEDTFRHEKVDRVTRIPAGRYKIELRKDSPMANRYQERFGTNGILWLKDVPNFKYVYIHVGNTDEDTEGCVLVGSEIQQSIKNGEITQKVLASTNTYRNLWILLAPEIEQEKEVYITIIDN